MLREIIFKKVVTIKCCEDSFSKKKLQTINVAMNSFKWKQNENKTLAFVVCSPKFPKNTFNRRTCLASRILFDENSESRNYKRITV